MYQLLVYYPDKAGAQAMINAVGADEVLDLIPKLLADHDGCEHVVVMMGTIRLFAVDCHGNRLP